MVSAGWLDLHEESMEQVATFAKGEIEGHRRRARCLASIQSLRVCSMENAIPLAQHVDERQRRHQLRMSTWNCALPQR